MGPALVIIKSPDPQNYEPLIAPEPENQAPICWRTRLPPSARCSASVASKMTFSSVVFFPAPRTSR